MVNRDGPRVLVTGGAGFIGCSISQLLAPRSGQYLVVDNLHPQVHAKRVRPSRLHMEARLVVEDVTEPGSWDRILDQFLPDLVIHLAAETGTGQSLTDSSRHAVVNVVGTTRMLDAFSAREFCPQRLLLCSSRAVYGEGPWERGDGRSFYPGQRSHRQLAMARWDFDDAHPLPSRAGETVPNPSSVYGATKLAQENVLRAWCGARNVPLTILRLQNVYGPGQSLTNSYTGIVSLFSRIARARETIPVYEDGQIVRDFVFIEDVATAIEAALSAPPQDVCLLDIGSGVGTTVWQLAHEIAKIRSAPPPVVTGMFRDGDVRSATCNIEPAEQVLHWHPAWDLPSGLKELQDSIDSELEPHG